MQNSTYKNISIRTELRTGDLGYVIYRHGALYGEEHGYGIAFEMYVAVGLAEFYQSYNTENDRVWICEDGEKIVGFLLAMRKNEMTVQFRYFYLEPKYRGIGLGKELMRLFINFVKEKGYKSVYLWTTNEQTAAIQLYKRYGFELTEEKESKVFGKPLIEQKFNLKIQY